LQKSEKYYGEVWFSDNQEDKRFCILSFKGDDLILGNVTTFPTLSWVTDCNNADSINDSYRIVYDQNHVQQ